MSGNRTNKSRNVVNLDAVKCGASEALMSAKVLGVRGLADGGSSRGGRKVDDDDTPADIDADPLAVIGLPLLAWRVCEWDECRLVTVTSDATETEDADGLKPDITDGMRAFGRGVRGTAVCVEAVDRDDDEDDAEGAGEAERGNKGIGLAGVGVRDGAGGRRASIVSEYRASNDEVRRFRLSCGSSLSYCKNSLA